MRSTEYLCLCVQSFLRYTPRQRPRIQKTMLHLPSPVQTWFRFTTVGAIHHGRGKIRRWQDFCRVLETNLRPPVGLAVIADCANMAMAREVVQPMEHFPMLADCAIRLRQSRSLALQRLAEITVLKLTGRASANPHVPFRFMELPRELRRQILWHTDLVAVCILEWNGKGHGYNHTRQLRPLEEYNNRCCMRCNDAGEACCCIVNHASFSSA